MNTWTATDIADWLDNTNSIRYAYDDAEKLTSITDYDNSSLTYAYDDAGNVTYDGSYWDYLYDGRNWLTSAIRKNSGATIAAAYTYTYDAGDNLVTKVEPWVDDFGDGSSSGDWNGSSSTDWPVTAYEARNVVGGSSRLLWKTNTDADLEVRFRYTNYDTSSNARNLFVSGRYTGAGDRVGVLIWPDRMLLQQFVASTSTWTTLDTELTAGSTQGQAYDVRMELDGADVKVWRDGALILQSNAATVTTTTVARFQTSANASFGVDNVMLLASGLTRTTTLGVNNANELTSLADYNGTTSYSYDELGRMISKSRGGSSATYAWHLDDRLMQVNSNFPGEGVVDYNYGGDGNRRTRTHNSVTTTYNWDAAFNVLSEENSGGSLTRTYVGRTLAHIDGATPASGTYSYYTHDHLASSRGLYDGSKNLTAAFEYSSYGDPFLFASAGATTRLFTGHDLDLTTGLYFAPFRYYGSGMARWMNADPLGMVDGPNLHAYVSNSPIRFYDSLGLACGWAGLAALASALGMGAAQGAAVIADAAIPFADPLQNLGAYSDMDPGIKGSKAAAAVAAATGGGVAGLRGLVALGKMAKNADKASKIGRALNKIAHNPKLRFGRGRYPGTGHANTPRVAGDWVPTKSKHLNLSCFGS